MVVKVIVEGKEISRTKMHYELTKEERIKEAAGQFERFEYLCFGLEIGLKTLQTDLIIAKKNRETWRSRLEKLGGEL